MCNVMEQNHMEGDGPRTLMKAPPLKIISKYFQKEKNTRTMTLVPQAKLQNKKLVKWSKTLIKRTYEKKSGKQMLQKVRTAPLTLESRNIKLCRQGTYTHNQH